MSGDLFPDAPVPAPAMPAWRTVPGLYGTSRARMWIHVSGAYVAHCGHHTALRPYAACPAEGEGFARKFATLAQAQHAALTGEEWPDGA